jgi:hypothetical protein
MSSDDGPACSFGGMGAGSSFTSKQHRSRSLDGPQGDGPEDKNESMGGRPAEPMRRPTGSALWCAVIPSTEVRGNRSAAKRAEVTQVKMLLRLVLT